MTTIETTIHGDRTTECFDFSLRHGAGIIPATFWNAPASAETPSLVLLQHGGPLHKRHERTDGLARSIAEKTGAAILLIDGPIHGQRRADQPEVMEMLGIFKRFWEDDAGIDGLVSDWSIAVDAVLNHGWAHPDRIAWFGVSMGAAYGIPVCAADQRIKAAAMGMWGIDWGQKARLISAAQQMKTPVLFQIKTGDEIFSTSGQRELFDALGSSDKHLRIHEGGHSLEAPGQLDELLGFISPALAGGHRQAGSAAAVAR